MHLHPRQGQCHYHTDVNSTVTQLINGGRGGTSKSRASSNNVGHDLRPSNQSVRAGQPTPQSHPHLLAPNQVTVGITADEYRGRRARLMELLSQQEGRHHVLVLPATPRRYMVDKIPFLYRQDTDLLWATGCLESDCVLVLHTLPTALPSASPAHRAVMFCPQHPTSQEVWDGPRTHHSDAPAVWGTDEGMSITELPRYLTNLERTLSSPTLWYQHRDPPHPATHHLLHSWLAEGGRNAGLEAPKPHLHRARLIKSAAEQLLMRHTCRVSAEAIRDTMAWTRPGLTEQQLFAKVDFECRMRGASHLAYPPVVAGGNRANVVHNINNDQMLSDGELLLMDAGSECHGYSGDVTRTWPVNGRFSSAQRELYEAVLHVQGAVLAALRDDRPSLDRLYRLMCSQLAATLPELGIVARDSTADHRLKVAMALCPHHVSHYLGMDVHDTPTVPRGEPLPPGSVITVEPGLYVPEGSHLAPARYHGIGIRIEDDILITDTGYEMLSDACPRHPDDIEGLMARHRAP